MLLTIAAAIWSASALDIGIDDVLPKAERWQGLGEFFGAALRPALDYENPDIPSGTPPIFVKALEAAGMTVTFAFCRHGPRAPLGRDPGLLCFDSLVEWRSRRGALARRHLLADARSRPRSMSLPER